ncbi:MAG: FecR family protein [Mangrovimonas sp.]|nr:FecR family protein [Mangrovimonas sp.]
MNKEDLIKKWLDNSLSPEELEAFKKLEDYAALTKLSNHLKFFKPEAYATDKELETVMGKIKAQNTPTSWFKPFLRIAAILFLSFSIYYFASGLDTTIHTLAASKTLVELPDHSSVNLNAGSSLVYNKRAWDDHREVTLDGEAFFKVAKGSKFDVVTSAGTVSVMGTQFNVKERDSYFEVICYEGLVKVSHETQETYLRPGDSFLILDGKIIATEKTQDLGPSWLNNTSNFKSVPLQMVLDELERQFNVTVNASSVDTSKLFTGSFTHDNLETALKSVTLPFHLSYSISNNTITLKRG